MAANAQLYGDTMNIVNRMKTSKSPEQFQEALLEFKKCALTLPFIFTSPRNKQERVDCIKHRLLVSQGYEVAVLHFATIDSEEADEQLNLHLALLKPFLFDKLLKNEMANNKNRLEIISLDLLNSLVNQRFRDYYCLYERLSVSERNTPRVQFVSNIEQWLMEGNYGTLLKNSSGKDAKGMLKVFKRGVEKLEGTVQNEVAQCLENAYSSISKKNALQMLKNDGKSGKPKLPDHWTVEKGTISFKSDEGALNRQVKITPDLSRQVMEESVGYAKELEKIV